MNGKNFRTVALLSISLISLELVWTRIFSAEYYYTFAFLILSAAVCGLGIGAVLLRLFPRFYEKDNLRKLLINTGITAVAGPLFVFWLELDFTRLFSVLMILKLIAAVIILGSAYVFGGMALSKIFRAHSDRLPKLYMADLAGAGIGVGIILLLMNFLGTQTAAALAGLPALAAAWLHSENKQKYLTAFYIAVTLVFAFFTSDPYESAREEKAKVLLTRWDALAKVRVVEFNQNYRAVMTDNTASSTVIRFDGDFQNPVWQNLDFGVNIKHLIRRYDSCKFVSLGAGGGKDVLQALLASAGKVWAVEVNPFINHLMQHGMLKEFSGSIYNDPRVNVVSEDGRIFIRRHSGKFDFICSFSSNSYAAMASGAFALAENFLYTKEALIDYWKALDEDGILLIEHHFYIPRMFAAAVEAFKPMFQDFSKHIAVYHVPEFRRDILIISKKPLDPGFYFTAFGNLSSPENHGMQLVFPSNSKNIFTEIFQKGWRSVQPDVRTDLSPPTDDRPFINQMGMWKNFSLSNTGSVQPFEFYGFPLSRLIIVIITLIVLLLVIPVTLLPYFRRGKKLPAGRWLFFFFIGFGFMAVEVILIQKHTLFIGASVYSLVTILLSLLLCSGIGSLFSGSFNIKIIFGAILAFILSEIFILESIRSSIIIDSAAVRMIISAVMLAPLGFFLGMPFPKAGREAGELVDWGFAVNGAASVLGASLSVLIALSFGFDYALAAAAAAYLLALFSYFLNK